MEDVGKGWEGDEETIGPGMAKGHVEAWDRAFGEKYREATSK